MIADDQTRTRVGGAVLLGLWAAVIYAIVLGHSSGGAAVSIEVHFGHMAGLTEGADVHLAGRLVGQLKTLELVPRDSVAESHPLYPTGGVTAHLRIDEAFSHRARIGGDYFVGSKGLFGKQYVEIGPPQEASLGRSIRSGDEIRGIDPPILDRAVYNAMRNFEAYRGFVSQVEPELNALTGELEELESNLREVLPERELWDRLLADSRSSSIQLRALIDEVGGLHKIDAVLARASATQSVVLDRAREVGVGLDHLDRELSRIGAASPAKLASRFRTAIERFRRSTEKLQQTMESAQELALMVARGEGTVGALLNDPEFSDDARRLGKILKRTPWRIIGHPGNEKPKFGKPPEPPNL